MYRLRRAPMISFRQKHMSTGVDRRGVPSFEKRAVLELSDGSKYPGISFGADQSMAGEVVFTTGMVGYPEALTDPSFQGQILNMTFPMIGNYGVPCTKELDQYGLNKHLESNRIHAAGMIVQDYSKHHSHWNAKSSLSEWLVKEGIPAIAGIDTRALTKKIRAKGALTGRIVVDGSPAPAFEDPNSRNLVAEVSTKDVKIYGKGNPLKILAVDCGIKYNIIRQLVQRGAEVKLVPWDHDIVSEMSWYDGLFISNGPGDPAMLQHTVAQLESIIASDNVKPIFGICLGNQLLGRAAGADTYKLPFGNRGQNQPVNNLKTGQSYITAQNHGYALDGKKLPTEWEELFVNGNDGTNEGIIHKTKPFFTAQFHPEHAGGPTDTEFLFDTFLDAVRTKTTGPITSLVQRPPTTRPQFKKVLILGSGGLSIGQAGEFDYSGSQAIKALKEENIHTILINPNIASVQTNVDKSTEAQADNVYYLPVNSDFVEQVIRRERPDGILISMGGQTALNCGVDLHHKGILEKYNVKVLGTQIPVIEATEDREIFNAKLKEINEKIATSFAAESVAEALEAADKIGYPVMIRSAFALGGLGSGICEDKKELTKMAKKAFAGSPQILVERSMKGWKEVEYEVVRDAANNCITVCNMENFDPLGIHTGDSMVIAPSQTLSNREYHMLRETALKVVRHLGIVGECNIQYALNPENEEYCIIEVNARLSRSSALASKATGYPLAFVAAKLGLGINLPELKNSVTKSTSACFEPSLDYCVAKVPRWDLSKFEHVSTEIGSSMKSVGEVMAIGRTFEETIQKALRMVEPSIEGFEPKAKDALSKADLIAALQRPTDKRMYQIAYALRENILSVQEIHDLTKIDTWFLSRLQRIADLDDDLTKLGSLSAVPDHLLREAKEVGFSDRQLARMLNCSDDAVRADRKARGIIPVIKQIDTLAAEYPAATNYLYTTYNASENDVADQPPNDGVMVLGSGAYRIGSSVEFDWCAVSCIRTLKKLGRRAVMLNYNPETVSTDYDECDQLYFEELSKERILDVYDRENVAGVVVSVGGQIPNNVALPLHKAGVRVLGTCPTMIDSAEDRHKFSELMDRAGVRQPAWKELTSLDAAKVFAHDVGYPVLVRPSYVLSGAAMNVAYSDDDLARVLGEAAAVSQDHPVVITKFVEGAREIELDGVARNGEIIAAAVSEHVENAGVHSGDATLILPPVDLSAYYIDQVRHAGAKIAKALNISGPFNAQFLAKGADVLAIECNLRASRSFPFVSKTVGADFISAATKVMVGADTSKDNLPGLFDPIRPQEYVGIKSPMFSYTRLGGADPLLGVEMASTGEVACFGKTKHEAFLKALLSSNFKLPKKNVLLSMQDKVSPDFVHHAHDLVNLGYTLHATEKTHAFLAKYNVPSVKLAFPLDEESAEENVLNYIKEGKIDLVINLPTSDSKRLKDNYLIRRTAADFSIPLLTNVSLVKLFVESMRIHREKPLLGLESSSLFDYYDSEDEKPWTAPNEFH
ncbi:carbamoyl-phosphate synthase (ammonia) [Saprolegnia diclina VS20]|uniref:Carbamoyl phosphate synthase arginine-specific large chain n=1 Tax=Saprolegnia diclina (strain VS20) TaxID=1156394 RepID=T0Q6Y7_SAPDV|nr:carbamoyl-phosphate synthase (ammonia) [Saprolegnia diclina VS20]EQC33624.1 carbamoyl-phosphate synthase (ammonia) [Saprolegnia diclina VS20]|eukprot:XP_008612847.1 carbamoyl-phosphate synthase (ammonia) [Saprolegnia diclina VS20]